MFISCISTIFGKFPSSLVQIFRISRDRTGKFWFRVKHLVTYMMDHHDILLTGGLTHKKTWVSFGFVASFHKTAGPNTAVVIQCECRERKFRGGHEGKQITQNYIFFCLSVNTTVYPRIKQKQLEIRKLLPWRRGVSGSGLLMQKQAFSFFSPERLVFEEKQKTRQHISQHCQRKLFIRHVNPLVVFVIGSHLTVTVATAALLQVTDGLIKQMCRSDPRGKFYCSNLFTAMEP